ncbi:unnamed protein product [Closterium sp. NIES-65]|nr:unnamed protein product [Closterium sp. NIES-65]
MSASACSATLLPAAPPRCAIPQSSASAYSPVPSASNRCRSPHALKKINRSPAFHGNPVLRLNAPRLHLRNLRSDSRMSTNGNASAVVNINVSLLSPSTSRRRAAQSPPPLLAGPTAAVGGGGGGSGGVWARAGAERRGGESAEDAGQDTPFLSGSGRVRPGSVAACAGNDGRAYAPVDQERADKAESGVLGLPYAFMRSGWLVSLVSLAATAALTHRGMHLLLAARALQEDWEAEKRQQQQQAGLLLPQQKQTQQQKLQKQGRMQEVKVVGDDGKEGVEQQRGGGGETDLLLVKASTEPSTPPAAPSVPAAAKPADETGQATTTTTTSSSTAIASRVGGKVRSYGDLGERVYGAVGRGAVDAMVLVSQGGFCAVFLVFMGHNVASVLWGSTLESSLVIAVIAPLQVMLSWLPSLTQLAPFSIFANCVNLCAFSLVIYHGLHSFQGLNSLSAFTTLQDAPFAFGVATYALNGAGMTLSVESSMRDRAQFPAVLATGLSVISVLYAAVGTAGYFGFGNETKEIVTLNLPPGWQSVAVKLGVCVALFFTFPVMMTPVHEMAERYLSSSRDIYNSFLSPSVAPSRRRLFVCFVRSLTVLFIVLLSVSVPHIGAFISLIGCSVCSALGFVVPALFHMKAARGKLENSAVVVDWFLVGFVEQPAPMEDEEGCAEIGRGGVRRGEMGEAARGNECATTPPEDSRN